MEVDLTSMTVSIPRDKIEKITKKCQNVIQSDQTTIQELLSINSSWNTTVEAVITAAQYVRYKRDLYLLNVYTILNRI